MKEGRNYTPLAYTKFNKTKKKLPKLLRQEIDTAVDYICRNPSLGEPKTGDLSGVFVYKFYLLKEEYLLAYIVDNEEKTVTLLAVGGHENFYRDLKRYLQC